jgi:hypothetical protein
MIKFDRSPAGIEVGRLVIPEAINSEDLDGDKRRFRQRLYEFRRYIAKFQLDPRTNIIIFLGAKCNKCNSDNIDSLEIDHIKGDGWEDRKYFTENGVHIWSYYMTFLEEAAEKLQLLCFDCHREKTKQNGDAWRRRPNDCKLDPVLVKEQIVN